MFQAKVQTDNKLIPNTVLPFYIKEFRTPKESKSRNPLATLRKRIGDLFREYCSHSSIHCINYIGSAQRSRWERLWWVAMLILSIYGCARLIQNIYYRWEHKPVIVSFDEKPTSVLQIPFPAVTICPETKFRPECLNFSALSEKFFEGNGKGKDTVNEEDYTPSRRRCFFSHERKLQFFAIYNQANCELECLTNYTRKLCSCVRFSMPHDGRTKICESYQLECCIQAENKVQLLIANEGIGKESLCVDQCRCLPACNSIEYDTEITQTNRQDI
ncbi:gonad-specific amiloride-sensitive sodium channel 1 [Culex quinquefasciatus]|uniref:Gonad-specific amiloride-sensitive sodium channel 1 n=1 Tax=Culex quinquefasciatus TaxID=7176 RepID=B0XES5_CULQU|nr:gonad-specific amiloride-sensitive sodium channel 1 [Culex quinquefasciatus]|eukprot:XP_001868147.1 gonad-specific amiloride-sensitive sodium channel 1 [Culex quinquefasciatus]